jgi:TPR repeat protein
MRGFGLKIWFGAMTALSILTVGCAGASPAAKGSAASAEATPKGSELDIASMLDDAASQALADASSAHWARACAAKPSLETRSVTLYGKACAAGDADGCTKFGGAYACGREVEKNGTAALASFDKACALHDANGCQLEAAALLAGNIVPRDTARGIKIYEKACATGSAPACGAIGSFLVLLGKPGTMERGVGYLERACAGGNNDSCGNMAVVETKGWAGHPADPKHAASVAKTGCEKKSPFSCGIYGALVLQGLGVPKDPASAAKLFEIACNDGDAMACANLATCHLQGIGTNQDVARAAELYKQACDNGNGTACRVLAELSTSAATSQGAQPSQTMF